MTPYESEMIDRVLVREGGFVDNPFDKGGATNMGLTLMTYSAYLGRPATLADLHALTPETAREVYYEMFFVRTHVLEIENDSIEELVFDAAINHGPVNAVKQLQRALGVTADGILGPQTLDAVHKAGAHELLLKLISTRLAFYGAIIHANPTQQTFAAGWFNRMANLVGAIS